MPRRFWLFKSEPSAFSWEDLKQEPESRAHWDGVRNYQARNFLRDQIKKNDGVLFYHSRVNPQVVAGTAKVVREAYPDHTQFDAKSKYYDPDSDPANPRWFMVDIQAVKDFKRPVSLKELRDVQALEKMVLLKKGSRLSIQPVTKEEWDIVVKLGRG